VQRNDPVTLLGQIQGMGDEDQSPGLGPIQQGGQDLRPALLVDMVESLIHNQQAGFSQNGSGYHQPAGLAQ
jgi:hypothetical protein